MYLVSLLSNLMNISKCKNFRFHQILLLNQTFSSAVCLYLIPKRKGGGSYREARSAWMRVAAGPGRSSARRVWGLEDHLHGSASWQQHRVPGPESPDTPGLLEALEGQRDQKKRL